MIDWMRGLWRSYRGRSFRPRHRPGEYDLQSYRIRSFLTIAGPLLVLAFYTFICVHFFQRPPIEGIIEYNSVNARAVYAIWFILAVLLMEWGRAGLANIEAAALMNPTLAPGTASQFMWHVDMNWASSLWWLNAMISMMRWLVRKVTRANPSHAAVSMPDGMWAMYSCTTALLLITLSLSGLTMEFTYVQRYGNKKVSIEGPNVTTFNLRAKDSLPRSISRNWLSGRPTRSFQRGSFFAPGGPNYTASDDYFTGQASEKVGTIEVFAGPATSESSHGTAWGLWSKLSCRCVDETDLEMIRVDPVIDGRDALQTNYSVLGCFPEIANGSAFPHTSTCDLNWINIQNQSRTPMWPVWLNETITTRLENGGDRESIQMIAVADGASGSHFGSPNQYHNAHGHDEWTFDSLTKNRSLLEPTTAMFEIHFRPPGVDDSINVHCDIGSLTGYAVMSAKTRTFSRFQYAEANSPLNNDPSGRNCEGPTCSYISPLQVLALGALAGNQLEGQIVRPLEPHPDILANHYRTTIMGYFDSLNIGHNQVGGNSTAFDLYPPLTRNAVVYATYKLFGETMIAMMSPASLSVWQGDLYTLESSKYLVEGTVPWQPVLALLACWAFILSGGGLWVMFFARKRWAPTLNGFEMFKFGAQYADEVNEFKSLEFRGNTAVLDRIPGMVGLLPGTADATTDSPGFVGLSENEVAKKRANMTGRAEMTMDRRKAAKTRP